VPSDELPQDRDQDQRDDAPHARFVPHRFEPAAAGFVAAIALLVGLVVWAMRVSRVEWDGQQVVWHSGFARRVVGTPGVGQIVRASVVSSVNFGAIQYWIDAQGKVAGRFIEKQWDPAELGRIAEQARIPMVDLGEVTAAELSQRYPAIMPKLQAKLIRDSSSDANVFGIPAQQFTRVLAGGVLVVMVVAVIIRGLVA